MDVKLKLLDHMRQVLRRKHRSIRTEEASISWVRRCMLFRDTRRPGERGLRNPLSRMDKGKI